MITPLLRDQLNTLRSLHKGTMPYFIYDVDGLREHAFALAKGRAKLFYACKANPLKRILQTVYEAGISLDVASWGELDQALGSGVLGKNIIMTGPAKSRDFLEKALFHGCGTVVIESLPQLDLLIDLCRSRDTLPSVLLRLQIRWESDETSVLGGGAVTAFGMDEDTTREALRRIRTTSLPFLGFHVFQWGNILSIDRFEAIWRHTFQVCQSITPHFDVLDVGGGLGIPYKGEPPLSFDEINTLIDRLMQSFKVKQVYLELGRYLVGPYGYYVTRVVDKKVTYGKNILILEGGINHLARPALTGSFFPVDLLRQSRAPLHSFSLHGPLCTSLDFMGEHMLNQDIDVGDTLVFSHVGAYGFTESMPFFLCHDLAGEAILEGGRISIRREAMPASSWLR